MDTPPPPKLRDNAQPLVTAAVVVVVVGIGIALFAYIEAGRKVSLQAVPQAAAEKQNQEDIRYVDPALVKWKEVAQFPAGPEEPSGLAVTAQGNVYVAVGHQVRLLNAAGQLLRAMQVEAEPTCLGTGPQGELFVGFRSYIRVYGPEGGVRATWPSLGDRAYVTCIAAEASGAWVADAGNRAVWHLDRNGTVIGEIGARDPAKGVPGLMVPSPHLDVVLLPSGKLLINDPGRRLVETYDRSGKLLGSWGKPGVEIASFSGCCNPTNLALLPDGGIVTAEKGLPRVKVYDQNGTFREVVAPPDDFSARAAGIVLAVDRSGRVLALDPPARVVRVFERKPVSPAPGPEASHSATE